MGYYELGISNFGKIRFNLKNKEIFDLAVNAFNKYSKYRNNIDHLNYFLQTLDITSALEGGFDAINTWDKAGLSVGFIQFARPNVNVYRVISQYDLTLANKVKAAYGTVDPYNDNKSLVARTNIKLLQEVQNSIITPKGIEAQFKICIEDFYDIAYEKFLSVKFYKEENVIPIQSFDEFQKSVINDLNKQTKAQNNPTKKNQIEANKYKIYANSFLFDIGVNRGVGILKKVKTESNIPLTEGNFIYSNINLHTRKERKEYWNDVIASIFEKGQITG